MGDMIKRSMIDRLTQIQLPSRLTPQIQIFKSKHSRQASSSTKMWNNGLNGQYQKEDQPSKTTPTENNKHKTKMFSDLCTPGDSKAPFGKN